MPINLRGTVGFLKFSYTINDRTRARRYDTDGHFSITLSGANPGKVTAQAHQSVASPRT
jgi:hypothetical protein